MQKLSAAMRQYVLVTANYWAFTLTDGALRMLVVLHFHELGYSPLEIASLFLFYEIFGVVTNLLGGWLGSYLGVNYTMNIGLALQIVALSMLLLPPESLSVVWVMLAQAISGIAKDLNKMSAKSSIKLLVPGDKQHALYRWTALLTGSKNALKGAGFFLGAALLSMGSFQLAIAILAGFLFVVWVFSVFSLQKNLGQMKKKPAFNEIFSKSSTINNLSAARLFLFAARDVWFVIALPVYLSSVLGWSHWQVGSFLACWVIAYGIVQSIAPNITGRTRGKLPNGDSASKWALCLSLLTAVLALILSMDGDSSEQVLIVGLLLFGAVFAINSSLHSFLIVSYANQDSVSLDIGFYYMANAMGRLVGTVLSGYLCQTAGIAVCLVVSSLFVLFAAVLAKRVTMHNS